VEAVYSSYQIQDGTVTQNRFRVLENALRKGIFGLKKDESSGRTLHGEAL
jgi:hypothetical protein